MRVWLGLMVVVAALVAGCGSSSGVHAADIRAAWCSGAGTNSGAQLEDGLQSCVVLLANTRRYSCPAMLWSTQREATAITDGRCTKLGPIVYPPKAREALAEMVATRICLRAAGFKPSGGASPYNSTAINGQPYESSQAVGQLWTAGPTFIGFYPRGDAHLIRQSRADRIRLDHGDVAVVAYGSAPRLKAVEQCAFPGWTPPPTAG